ncbi:GTP cyclohydrolase II RibA [Catenuloplanes sp. NPDC051500]|uniref:GTP cyclohydrolase II RibA n=1 Tax=Catenuloplanes sp. NPDC051500 TaxID=3363959 RepID=UPI00378925B6
MILPPQRTGDPAPAPVEVCSVVIPTPYGEFRTRVFETAAGHTLLALIRGDVTGSDPVLTRLHSECLTGDALGSLRCDCGVQLRTAMRTVAAAGRGVVLYITGHEGRGIGLVNKLRAYVEQDNGADTLDANLRLGLPADARTYGESAAVLRAIGIESVNLMSNNPDKVEGLRAGGLAVQSMVGMQTAAHARNAGYLLTKAARMGHVAPIGDAPISVPEAGIDVRGLIGDIRPHADRPYVMVRVTQTLDGRLQREPGIPTAEEHALRAAVDAVLVGAGTVRRSDPALTVELVPGAHPLRVVLDADLDLPLTARVFGGEAATTVFTTKEADAARADAVQAAGVGLREVSAGPSGVELPAVLAELRRSGVQSVLVEGGTGLIAELLRAGLADRLIVAISATTETSGDTRLPTGLALTNRSAYTSGDALLLGWDVPA